jgi:gas vesicle protein
MADQNNMNGKDFLIGVLVGSIIGASVAFLMAPKSGRELRQDLSEGYETVSKKTQELARQVSEYSDILVDRVKEVAQQLKDEVQSLKQKNAAGHQHVGVVRQAVDYVEADDDKPIPASTAYNDVQAKVDEVKREVEEVKKRLEEQ